MSNALCSFVSIRCHFFLLGISLNGCVSWVFDAFASEWNIISINVINTECFSDSIQTIQPILFNVSLLWLKRSNSCQREFPCSASPELPFNRTFVIRFRDVSHENFCKCVADYYECWLGGGDSVLVALYLFEEYSLIFCSNIWSSRHKLLTNRKEILFFFLDFELKMQNTNKAVYSFVTIGGHRQEVLEPTYWLYRIGLIILSPLLSVGEMFSFLQSFHSMPSVPCGFAYIQDTEQQPQKKRYTHCETQLANKFTISTENSLRHSLFSILAWH